MNRIFIEKTDESREIWGDRLRNRAALIGRQKGKVAGGDPRFLRQEGHRGAFLVLVAFTMNQRSAVDSETLRLYKYSIRLFRIASSCLENFDPNDRQSKTQQNFHRAGSHDKSQAQIQNFARRRKYCCS